MTFKDTSSPRVASIASRGLFDPASLTLDDVRAVCATALARVPDHRQEAIVQARPRYEQIDMALAIARCDDVPDEMAGEWAAPACDHPGIEGFTAFIAEEIRRRGGSRPR